MPGSLQPLVNNQRISNPDGTPTEYFIRWAQQRQIDIVAGITAEQAVDLIEDWAAQRQIIAGAGMDGGGPLSSNVTLDADVQEILDQITNVQGSILYRGAAAWAALAPGTSGHFLKTNGAGANPAWAAGGGGGGNWWFLPPAASSFTLVSGDATNLTLTDNTDAGLLINGGAPASGNIQRMAYRTLTNSALDWTCIVRRDSIMPDDDFSNSFGIMLMDSVGGRLVTLGQDSTNFNRVTINRYNSLSSYNSTPNSENFRTTIIPWYKIARVGSNVTFSVSVDGKQWIDIVTESPTAWLANAPNRIGLGVSYNRGGGFRNLLTVDYFSLTGPAV